MERDIPSMTPAVVHDYLRETGKNWQGKGVAMELGCWLGASSRPLLEGLSQAGYDKPFWAFDRWQATPNEVRKAATGGHRLKIGQDLIDPYMHNVTPAYGAINAFKGYIPEVLKKYDGSPIEICLFDAPKTNPVFRESMEILLPYFVPGAILGLLDFYSYKKHKGSKRKKFMAPVYFINENSFTMLASWPDECSCAFFKYNALDC